MRLAPLGRVISQPLPSLHRIDTAAVAVSEESYGAFQRCFPWLAPAGQVPSLTQLKCRVI